MTRRLLSRCGHWVLAVAAALLFAGCATLPDEAPRPPTRTIAVSADTALGKIALASQPDPDLSGFRLMPGGDFAFDTRIQLARRAQRTLDVQYYQIENDETGRYLLRTLRDAAQRGVRVRLLMDDLYTSGEDELLLGLAATPNVELRLFNPFPAGRGSLLKRFAASLFDFSRVNRRMHNKLFIADGAMAVAGGRNIGNQYFTRTAGENFIDLDTFVTGALIPRLGVLFDQYWNSVYVRPVQSVIASELSREELQKRFDAATGPDTTPPPPKPAPNDLLGYSPMADDLNAGKLGLIWTLAEAYADSPERVIGKTASYGGVPLLDVDSVRYNVVEQMRRARSEVTIVSPYLIPGAAGLEVMKEIRQRNVKISVVTNSLAATDEPLVHTAYRRYRPEMLKLGADLYELSTTRTRRSVRLGLFGTSVGRLHAKSAVIDRSILFVGSMNFDPRSETHNTEIGLFIRSPEMAEQTLKLIDVLKQQGAYRLRFVQDSGESRIEWVSEDAGKTTVLNEEPDSGFWDRTMLELLAPLTPESLL
ncbi:phospholipase D family protein [Variovorax sp. 770b2]|uniref:phospholipase D family protein n=1 Tax=Variovorax sp. 770b2 TaxID=1566271 RepID=UPI0008EEF47D|nr:phospholipase D family protein [Variovorax sp. 770b2]SFP84974.1 Phosphatidylserine/phosphatidylglycerophosphate/cardiolipin synthase [Variovorax sp. 770b2]